VEWKELHLGSRTLCHSSTVRSRLGSRPLCPSFRGLHFYCRPLALIPRDSG
jgi:hypothetical protein